MSEVSRADLESLEDQIRKVREQVQQGTLRQDEADQRMNGFDRRLTVHERGSFDTDQRAEALLGRVDLLLRTRYLPPDRRRHLAVVPRDV